MKKEKVYKKILTVKITGCSDCPYCQYDGYYSMSQSAGWDCNNDNSPQSRIIDEGPSEQVYGRRSKKVKEWNEEFNRLMNQQPPDWCPLSSVEGE